MAEINWYEVLGVPEDVSADELRKAYRKLVKFLHPDMSHDVDTAQFIAVQSAYEVLRDPVKRKLHDELLLLRREEERRREEQKRRDELCLRAWELRRRQFEETSARYEREYTEYLRCRQEEEVYETGISNSIHITTYDKYQVRALDVHTLFMYILGGKSTVTIVVDDALRYTYKIRKSKSKRMWYIRFVTVGPDELHVDNRIGRIDHMYNFLPMTTHILNEAYNEVAWFKYIFNVASNVERGERLAENVKVYHAGRCARCNRSLTTERSLNVGLGPACEKKILKEMGRKI